jgi:UDP-N-acetylglucosamine--N-acetylmuramyl-(pentapeptide) pyrophosphoryl-undecaprenol N-acetylglucosamine transferase
VSGGGTGGHISPVLAVVSELKKLDPHAEILYIGSKEGLESKIVPQTGLDYREISSGKFRRYHSNTVLNIIDPTTLFKNIRDLFRFVRGIFEANRIIREYDPDVIFTKGGFVSLPVGIAAGFAGYPYVIHESDSIMGMSNRHLAKKAVKIAVSYPKKYYEDLDEERVVYTGNPIREDVLDGSEKSGLEEFKLNKDLPVLMVIGGSQGALAINQVVSGALNKLLPNYQIIHVSGERDYDWLSYQAQKLPEELRQNYHLYNFLSGNLKDAYAVADLVISRAGNNELLSLRPWPSRRYLFRCHLPLIIINWRMLG